jgi:hypothetical protein
MAVRLETTPAQATVSRRRFRYTLPGAWVALAFACLAFTPSLLPRSALLQGVVCGISAAIGYGVGAAGAWVWRAFADRDPRPPRPRGLAGLRHLGRGRSAPGRRCGPVVAGAAARPHGRAHAQPPAAGAAAAGRDRALRRAGRPVPIPARGLPPGRRAAAAVDGAAGRESPRLGGGGRHDLAGDQRPAAERARLARRPELLGPQLRHRRRRRAAHQPASIGRPRLAGVLGVARPPGAHHHRDRPGPTAAEIAAFNGTTATEPIRAYAGTVSAADTEERAKLAVDDLERAGGFDRANLLVATTTGSSTPTCRPGCPTWSTRRRPGRRAASCSTPSTTAGPSGRRLTGRGCSRSA